MLQAHCVFPLWVRAAIVLGSCVRRPPVQVQKYRRPSIVAVMMAVMVTTASVLLIILGGVRVDRDVRLQQHLRWKPICP